MRIRLNSGLTLLLGVAMVAGCDAPGPTAGTPLSPGPSLAQQKVDTHSRPNLVWDDLVADGVPTAGIRGDGRNKFGQAVAPLNEYQGEHCGVRGFVYDLRGESGNVDFDADTYYNAATMASACGPSRALAFYTGTSSSISTTPSVILGPHVIVSALWSLAPGASRLQPQLMGMQGLFPCGIHYDAKFAGASNVRVTRLPDVGGVRQWRMASQGNHVAACATQSQSGKWVDTGTRYYLPFAATITQVPYPFATFP